NATKCDPEWSEQELLHKYEDALEYDNQDYPYGCKLFDLKVSYRDPHRLATEFNQNKTLKFWQKSFWLYDGKKYKEVMEYEIEAELTTFRERQMVKASPAILEAAYMSYEEEVKKAKKNKQEPPQFEMPLKPQVTTHLIADVKAHVKGLTKVSNNVPMPSFLSN